MEWLAGLARVFLGSFRMSCSIREPLLVCECECVRACVSKKSFYISMCKCLYFLSSRVILNVYALFFFFSAFTINKVGQKEDWRSVHYVISLDHTGPVLTHRPPKNLACQLRKRDKEETESITTLISPSSVSHPSGYHITHLLSSN